MILIFIDFQININKETKLIIAKKAVMRPVRSSPVALPLILRFFGILNAVAIFSCA